MEGSLNSLLKQLMRPPLASSTETHYPSCLSATQTAPSTHHNLKLWILKKTSRSLKYWSKEFSVTSFQLTRLGRERVSNFFSKSSITRAGCRLLSDIRALIRKCKSNMIFLFLDFNKRVVHGAERVFIGSWIGGISNSGQIVRSAGKRREGRGIQSLEVRNRSNRTERVIFRDLECAQWSKNIIISFFYHGFTFDKRTCRIRSLNSWKFRLRDLLRP